MPTPRPLFKDTLGIGRELRSDSEALRYAEYWVRRKIDALDQQEARWLYDQYKIAYQRMASTLQTVYDSAGKPQLVLRAQLLNQIERELWSLYAVIDQHMDETFLTAAQQGYWAGVGAGHGDQSGYHSEFCADAPP